MVPYKFMVGRYRSIKLGNKMVKHNTVYTGAMFTSSFKSKFRSTANFPSGLNIIILWITLELCWNVKFSYASSTALSITGTSEPEPTPEGEGPTPESEGATPESEVTTTPEGEGRPRVTGARHLPIVAYRA